MYSDAFCKVYNEFGWNYFPEVFGEQLLAWLSKHRIPVKTSLDLACGTGILCDILQKNGIEASGMDLSEGMIAIARENNPHVAYEVADMITYRPGKTFDLVTCTGDALNHIIDLSDVEQILKNVRGYLSDGGYFIFDVLTEKEVPKSEPIPLDFSDTVKASFTVTQDPDGIINLKTSVYENGKLDFEENITETLHDPQLLCELLCRNGFQIVKCGDQLLEDTAAHGTTCFIAAKAVR